MGARNPEKELKKNFGNFDTCVDLVESALSSTKTKIKKLNELKNGLESLFYSFDETYRVYKADIIEKEAKTEDMFNEKDEHGAPNFPHNDVWKKEQFTRYVDKGELIEEKIEAMEKADESTNEAKPLETMKEVVEHVVTELEAEKTSLGQSIGAFVDEVASCDLIAMATAEAMEKFSEKLKMRLEDLKLKSRKVDDTLREEVNDFCNMQYSKIDSVLLSICKKIPEPPPSSHHSSPSSNFTSGKEQVHLEKSKPPKFKGEEVDYPEFKRKWLSTVSKANLPQESEVDKLRDSIPPDAKDQLYGVNDTASAWRILDKRYGDKKIISMN